MHSMQFSPTLRHWKTAGAGRIQLLLVTGYVSASAGSGSIPVNR